MDENKPEQIEVHENKTAVHKKEKDPDRRKKIMRDVNDMKDGIIKNVVEPKIKDLVYSIVDNILNTIKASAQMAIFKEVRPDQQYPYGVETYSYRQNTNYHAVSNQNKPKGYIRYDQVVFSDYMTAENLKKKLELIFARYHRLRISDVYNELRDIAPMAKGDYTNANYGWTDIENMRIVNDSSGWYISYPPPTYIG